MHVTTPTNRIGCIVTAFAVSLCIASSGESSEGTEASGDTGGAVWTWGEDTYGQLGQSPPRGFDSYKPIAITEVGSAKVVAAGYFDSMAIDAADSLWTWGALREQEPGVAPKSLRGTPSRVPDLQGVRAIAGGRYFSVAVLMDGTVRAWGANHSGQLGDGTTQYRARPVLVHGVAEVKVVAAGRDFAVALKRDGTVWTWGANESGELGIGTKENRSTPTMMIGLNHVKAIACGDYMTMALKDDGTVWGCGYNWYGNLGDGTEINRDSPVQVKGLDSVVAIACGAYHTLAIKNDATVWGWGYGYKGELGMGQGFRDEVHAATQIPGLKNIVDVAAGWDFSLAVDREGALWAFGRNWYGQFGTKEPRESLVPVKIRGISGIEKITCGTHHTIAVRAEPRQKDTGDSK